MIGKNTTYCGVVWAMLLPACGSTPDSPTPGNNGGSNAAASGGSVSAGTAGANTSGAASGGASNGGSSTSGGGNAAGGSTSSAGAASGGTAITTGGTATTSGGTTATSGGAAGSTAGSTASAGAAGAAQSTGCGATTWPPGDGSSLQTIDVAGATRQYILSLPANYDTNKPHRVVYAWHGRTGTAAQIAGGGSRAFYGLKTLLTDTIFVAGQGLGTDADAADTGWPNTGGRDIALVRALVTHLAATYCVDQNRIMSTGFSYGGIMSNTIGCQMSDVFRAIAPIAGAYFGGRGSACNTHPIAYLGIHGTADDQVTYANGETARDLFRTSAHCGTATQPTATSPCVAYDGCDSGYPVQWCSHSGGHTVPSFSAAGIAAFFKQF